MKTKTILLALMATMCLFANAQTLTDLVNDTTLNYKQIKKKLKDNPMYFENASEKELKYFHRWDWFWSTRVDKHGSMKVADKVMAKYLKELEKELRKEEDSHKSAKIPDKWESRGPWNDNAIALRISGDAIIGRIQCVWADPDAPNTLLIGTNNNGLWKSTNGGTTWYKLTHYIPGGIMDIAVNPKFKDIIYILTGTSSNGFVKRGYATGLWQSVDGGASWTQNRLNLSEDYPQNILVNKFNYNDIYVLSNKALYHSINGGSSWTKRLTAKSYQKFEQIKQNPNANNSFYITGINSFYTGTGLAWNDKSTTVDNDLTSDPYVDWRIGVDCGTDNILYGFIYKWETSSGMDLPVIKKYVRVMQIPFLGQKMRLSVVLLL